MPMRTAEVPWFLGSFWFLGTAFVFGSPVPTPYREPEPGTGFSDLPLTRCRGTKNTHHVGGMSHPLKSPPPVGSPEPTHNPRG